MGRKFTFVGLVQSATKAGNAPRFIRYKDRVYRWANGDYISTVDKKWTLMDQIFEEFDRLNFYELNDEYLFETVDNVQLKKEEIAILESLIKFLEAKVVLDIQTYDCTHGLNIVRGLCIRFKPDPDYVGYFEEHYVFPSTMFKNMETGKRYSVEELNLFEEDDYDD